MRPDNYLNEEVPTWDEVPQIDRLFMVEHTRVMAESIFARGNEELLPDARWMSDYDLAKAAFEANFALLSHNVDHILNYGNRQARALWRFSWDDFTETPSEETAPKAVRAKRANLIDTDYAKLNEEMLRHCQVSDRIFFIGPPVTVWSLNDEAGNRTGLAAKFDRWRYIK